MKKKLRKKLLFFSCNHEAMLLCHHRANSVIVTFIFVILIFFFFSKKFGDFGEDILNSGVIGASLYSDNDEEIQPNFVVITFRNKFTNVNITGIYFMKLQ